MNKVGKIVNWLAFQTFALIHAFALIIVIFKALVFIDSADYETGISMLLIVIMYTQSIGDKNAIEKVRNYFGM